MAVIRATSHSMELGRGENRPSHPRPSLCDLQHTSASRSHQDESGDRVVVLSSAGTQQRQGRTDSHDFLVALGLLQGKGTGLGDRHMTRGTVLSLSLSFLPVRWDNEICMGEGCSGQRTHGLFLCDGD